MRNLYALILGASVSLVPAAVSAMPFGFAVKGSTSESSALESPTDSVVDSPVVAAEVVAPLLGALEVDDEQAARSAAANASAPTATTRVRPGMVLSEEVGTRRVLSR